MPRARSRSRSRSRSRRRSPTRSRSRSREEGELTRNSTDSEDSSSAEEVSNDERRDGSSSSEESEDGKLPDDVFASLCQQLKRVDAKEITLKLRKTSLEVYFNEVLGDGALDKDGNKLLKERYYLSDKQFKLLAAPDLQDSKLHVVKGLDMSGLASRLLGVHAKLRDVVKVLLKIFEGILAGCHALDEYKLKLYKETEDGSVQFSDQFSLSKCLSRVLSEEDYARFNPSPEMETLHKAALKLTAGADSSARLGKEHLNQARADLWDLMTLVGQVDVALTNTREKKFEGEYYHLSDTLFLNAITLLCFRLPAALLQVRDPGS